MTEILNRSDISCMQLFIDELVHQSSEIGSLIMARINTLEERRELLTKQFFRRAIMPESSCLHYLLPDKGDSDIFNKLWCPKIFQPLTNRSTLRFRKSFLPYCLNNFMKFTAMIYYMINILLALYFILLYLYCISIQPLADI